MELSDVLWIGGPAGAGKTTVARQLARRHGLRWYNSDARTWEHRDRALAAGVDLPPRGPGSRHYDRRPMVLDDLSGLPASPLVVADGPLTPSMATLLLSSGRLDPTRAVWLLPSQSAQQDRLRIRHPEGVPTGYLTSWEIMQPRDSSITRIDVDDQTVAETIHEVERVFAPYLAAGPVATDREERRSLLRYGNQAIVAQCTSPTARPLRTVGDPGQVVRAFDCECAEPSCDALVELRVSAAVAAVRHAPPAIVATGH